MENELKTARISIIIHALVGIVFGLISPLIGIAVYALGAGILVAMGLGRLMERFLGKKKFSWWIGNGLFIYLFAWIDMWIFVVNFF